MSISLSKRVLLLMLLTYQSRDVSVYSVSPGGINFNYKKFYKTSFIYAHTAASAHDKRVEYKNKMQNNNEKIN